MLIAFIVGAVLGLWIGLWIGIRIGKGLAVFSLGHDIWNKLK